MAVNVGINGFGRIGRYLTRLIAEDNDLNLVAINARASNEDLALLLKHDSVHGKFAAEVVPNEKGFTVNGKQILITRCAPGEWEWEKLQCDLVIETTGKFRDRESCEKALACGAKKVIISAPGRHPDITVVMGVNDDQLTPEHKIISAASCTTNCLAPATKVIHDNFGISHGLMTTVHAYTMSQRVLDGTHSDIRRGRTCGSNIVPTTTGAAKSLKHVIPELEGKLDGMSIRVPTPDVSLVDLTCTVEKETTVEEVNAVLKAASNENMGYTEMPLVSTDYIGDTHGGVVDGPLTSVMNGNMIKLIVWYDNEASFTNQLVRLTKKTATML
ncbi:type I glyceraldehyde-3-phosphate dehydrogenase [Maridesulfovibrio bastinii]|uniref:type I glyceraldehyde-3-phosphate dehydrogenase n=1 Tax=Maridesulfovibrio bastinii TaxID=47157 RepID=UPI000401ECC0|nr:type I glyceraldehyde-3-phosphate dehydrogenase [Maridesulfovibrio bastinii]